MVHFENELADSQDEFSDLELEEELSQPVKRRRLSDNEDETGDETDYFSSSPDRRGSKKRKPKSFVPKHTPNQEDIFVTQLTQPPSSPEKIRGPRWVKEPSRPAPAPVRTAPDDDHDDYDDDDDLKAAIAASLDSFHQENYGIGIPGGMQNENGNGNPGRAEKPIDIGDIPEDAFDSSPSLSPPTRPERYSTGNNNSSRSGPLRQTTLFGMFAKDSNKDATAAHTQPEGTKQPETTSKDDRATHHKLDREAIKTWVYPTNLGGVREYQFNITQRGLFNNLLVALPTGLGKTFIAATIMLNWFRWTRDAKIIFVAPTKPLVAQQISACYGIAGIPRSKTTMLTGEASPGVRAEEWQEKRVFFMTPQTVLNDLKSGIADPKRIVLLVVDEAHRATGGYAYVEVVKFLKRFNQDFRVLGLTATPGSTLEAVQGVIDGLDIARVEIRTEQSLDIREYVHGRNVDVETFENSEDMMMCMELFSAALQPLLDELRTLNAYWGRDPMTLTPYGLTKARQQWMASDAGRKASMGLKGKTNTIFTMLASLAHGIDLLKYHGIIPFYRALVHFQDNAGKGKTVRELLNDDNFKKLMSRLDAWRKNPEFIGHPKLEYLKQVVLNHFLDAGDGLGDEQSNTRIMIFVHFRDSAEEVARVLKRFEPMIRPHVFIGQTSAKGSEGMDQKTQLSVVEKFKQGTYNTIVATSIGEEGLDIGEVDMIVCYDSSQSPVRMLQRMGRTGRKRTGNIVLLLMRGKEEQSYIMAKDNYEKMQQVIASGSQFTFHEDRSRRILPREVKPDLDKRHVDIPKENSQVSGLPEPKKKGGRAPKRPPKKFHMPDEVETGFRKASRLGDSGGSGGGGKSDTGKTDKTGNTGKTDKRKDHENKPGTEPVQEPALEEVLLTPDEQQELEVRYQTIGGGTPQIIGMPRNDAFPRLQLTARPTKMVKHGSVTRRMINTLRRMDESNEGCEQYYRRILDGEVAKAKKREDMVKDSRAKDSTIHDLESNDDDDENGNVNENDEETKSQSSVVDLTASRDVTEYDVPESQMAGSQDDEILRQYLPSQLSALDDDNKASGESSEDELSIFFD